MGQDEIRYSVQLVGEKVGEIAQDVGEIKAEVKSQGTRLYNLEIEAALSRGATLASANRRTSVAHRVTVISGLCGALALFVTIFATVVHL